MEKSKLMVDKNNYFLGLSKEGKPVMYPPCKYAQKLLDRVQKRHIATLSFRLKTKKKTLIFYLFQSLFLDELMNASIYTLILHILHLICATGFCH